jgi:hypothetical protein
MVKLFCLRRSLFIDGKKFEGGLGTHTIIGQLQLADPQATNTP